MSHDFLNDSMGEWLSAQTLQTRRWMHWLIACLAGLIVINVFFHPLAEAPEIASTGPVESMFWVIDSPHFGLDVYFGFWPLFGLVATLVIAVVLKKGIFPLICRPEDHYERH